MGSVTESETLGGRGKRDMALPKPVVLIFRPHHWAVVTTGPFSTHFTWQDQRLVWPPLTLSVPPPLSTALPISLQGHPEGLSISK